MVLNFHVFWLVACVCGGRGEGGGGQLLPIIYELTCPKIVKQIIPFWFSDRVKQYRSWKWNLTLNYCHNNLNIHIKLSNSSDEVIKAFLVKLDEILKETKLFFEGTGGELLLCHGWPRWTISCCTTVPEYQRPAVSIIIKIWRPVPLS